MIKVGLKRLGRRSSRGWKIGGIRVEAQNLGLRVRFEGCNIVPMEGFHKLS